MLTFQ